VRQAGLPDVLCAAIIDPEKADAFVIGVSRLRSDSLALLSNQTVRLNMPELQLHAYSAVIARQLSDHLSLAKLEVNDHPRFAGVRVTTPLSPELARARIEDARKAVRDRDERLRRLSGVKLKHDEFGEKAQIRQERSSAVSVWLSLAEDLARQDPAAADVDALIRTARKAMRDDFVPSSPAMPGPVGQ
jgi:hypothetical protein